MIKGNQKGRNTTYPSSSGGCFTLLSSSGGCKPNRGSQKGRSMIEMLGVLAIIGVLSVGGIAGYTKAMFKYKVNKTIEQITYIAFGIQTLYANQNGVENLWPDVLKKSGIIEANAQTQNYSDTSIPSGTRIQKPPLGSFMIVYTSSQPTLYHITLYNFSQEACFALLGYNWSAIDNFHHFTGNGIVAYANPQNPQDLSVPVSLNILEQKCTDDNNNRLYLTFSLK